VVLDQIQRSGARCDAVGLICGSSPIGKGATLALRALLWSMDGLAWTGTCNVTEELEAGGTDAVCKSWLVSTAADLFIRNVTFHCS